MMYSSQQTYHEREKQLLQALSQEVPGYDIAEIEEQLLAKKRPTPAEQFGDHEMFEREIEAKVREINGQKEKAVQEMNFELAVTLRNGLALLKKMGEQLKALKEKRNAALRNDDLSEAKRLHGQCLALLGKILKYQVNHNETEFNFLRQSNKYTQMMDRLDNKLETIGARRHETYSAHGLLDPFETQAALRPKKEPKEADYYLHDSPSKMVALDDHVDYSLPVPDEDIIIKGLFREKIGKPTMAPSAGRRGGPPAGVNDVGFDDEELKRDPNDPNQQRFFAVDVNRSAEERPIPTLDQGGPGRVGGLELGESLQMDPPDRQGKYNLQGLNSADREMVDGLVPTFPEDLIGNLMASKWQNRSQAIFQIREQLEKLNLKSIQNPYDREAIVVGLFSVVDRGLLDKVTQVNIEALFLLDSVVSGPFMQINQFHSQKFNDHYKDRISSILEGLLFKMGDNNSKVRSQAFETTMLIHSHPLITFQRVAQKILARFDPGQVTSERMRVVGTSTRHQSNKLSLLGHLIESNKQQFVSNQIDIVDSTNLGVEHLGSKSAQVRQEAYMLLLKIYKLIGHKMLPLFKAARPAQTEIFNEAAKLINQGDNKAAEELIKRQTLLATTTGSSIYDKFEEATGNKDEALTRGLKVSLEPGPDGKYELVQICKYCGKEDQYFQEPAVMKSHIKHRCKMLTECKHCHDLVEASELKEHYLNHCKKGPFAQCPRCTEVFKKTDYEKKHHVEKEVAGKCKALIHRQEVRCGLCEENIVDFAVAKDMKEYWKDHLMVNCKKNPRIKLKGPEKK